jgi:hypothetical protein
VSEPKQNLLRVVPGSGPAQLRGFAQQAMQVAAECLEEAEKLGHPVSLSFALIYVATLHLWGGKLPAATAIIERLLAHAERHFLAPYYTVGLGLRAGLRLCNGDAAGAVELLRTCLRTLDAERHRILTGVFVSDLAQSLSMLGRLDEALAAVDEALAMGGNDESSFCTPELLRIRARILSLRSAPEPSEVEKCLLRALEMARHKAALAWELRTATDLARRASA